MRLQQDPAEPPSREEIRQVLVEKRIDQFVEYIEENKDEKNSSVTDLQAYIQFIELHMITA